MKVLYVVSKWNQPTETFVRREVAAALASGVRVQVVSLQRPASSDGIVDDTAVDVVVPSLNEFPRALSGAMVTSPGAVLGALVRIAVMGRPGTWIPHLKAWGAAVVVSRRANDYDVVMAHFAWLSSTAADVLGRLHDRPYVIFAHAHAIYMQRCIDRYLADRLRRAGRVFVESESIASDVERRFGVHPVVMRMGVPRRFVSEVPRDSSGDDPAEVVSVGALRKKKGHDIAIRAVAGLPDVRLTIAGEGEERSSLERLIEELGVQDRVELLGHRTMDQVRSLLDSATIFCLPSRLVADGDRDGVPNVLIEAMARGVPVIATAVSGIPDLVEGHGSVVEPENVEALRASLRLRLSNRDDVSDAVRALDRIREDYTTELNWLRLQEHLASVLTEARS